MMLQDAIRYVRRGFSVIPLKRDKKPMLPAWAEYQSHKASEETLREWFETNGNANIGIVTGKVSGIVVVDLDTREAVETVRRMGLPKTPTVKTSKGYHLYYKYPDNGEVRNFQKRSDLPGIDLRGDGGYVVAPPSVHESGAAYEWMKGKGLDDRPMAEFPQVLLQKPDAEREDKKLSEAYSGVGEGERNNTLARLVGSWIGRGLSKEETLTLALEMNQRNKPPLIEQEVEKTVNSVWKSDQRKRAQGGGNVSIIPQARSTMDITQMFKTADDIRNQPVNQDYLQTS